MAFASDTWKARQSEYRRLEDIEDAYYAAKYPQPVEEKAKAEASTGRSFDRWKR